MNELVNENTFHKKKIGTKIEFSLPSDIETVWMSQAQIANFFNTTLQDVQSHIITLLDTHKIDKKNNMRSIHYIDYKQNNEQAKLIPQYSLTFIIAIALKINTAEAIDFQKWVVEKINRHLVMGFSVNKFRLNETEKRKALYKKQLIE